MLLSEIADLTNTTLQGDDRDITGVGTLETGQKGEIAFLANAKYRRYLDSTSVSAVILSAADAKVADISCLVSTNPYLSYAHVAKLFLPTRSAPVGIHGSAEVDVSADIDPSASIGPLVVISAGAKVGKNVIIAAGSVIGENVVIRDNTEIEANVTLWHDVQIGQDCLIHSGAVIGADGFGNARDGARWVKIPQLGSVVLGDRVEVGANSSIDRGAVEDTVIGDGVRIDNQVQIGHNVVIGEDTAIAALCGIAGSAKLGKRIMMGGMAGVAGHISVGDDSFINGMSMVTTPLDDKSGVGSGMPAKPVRQWRRSIARINNLDKLEARIKDLEKKLDSISNKD